MLEFRAIKPFFCSKAKEDLAPASDRDLGPGEAGDASGFHCSVHLAGVRVGDLGDLLPGRGIEDVAKAVRRGCARFTVDPMGEHGMGHGYFLSPRS